MQSGNRGSLPKRPSNVNHWGREGEKYRPGITRASNNNPNDQETDEIQGIVDIML